MTSEQQQTTPAAPAARRSSQRGLVAIAAAIGLLSVAGVGAAQLAGPGLLTPQVLAAQTTASTTLAAPAGTAASVAQTVGPAVVSIRTNAGLGSGVIYDASGLILTNAHVVDGAQSMTVGLVDGRHFAGRVVGADTGFDVAVVKIEGANLPTAPLGSVSSLQVGQDVVAIGNPFGLDHTLTTGVVSALYRPISEGQGTYNQPMIQTDAAINPGNSGGALLDLNGNVIGINTMVVAPMGYPAQGLGFAVPVDTAKRIADQLVQTGRVTNSGQPYLGVSLGDINRPDRVPGQPGQQLPIPGMPGQPRGTTPARPQAPAGVDHGAVVGSLAPNSPAAQAGVRASDVFVNFDGFDIYNPDELLQRLVMHKPGDQVSATVIRNGQPTNVTITLGEAPVAS